MNEILIKLLGAMLAMPMIGTGEPGQVSSRIALNIVLPGGGTVHVGPMRLVEYEQMAPAAAGHWWSIRTASYLGAIGGTAIGIWGAILGCLAGVLIPRGRGRQLIMGMLVLGLCFGIPVLIAGIVAAAVGQPYHVYYPLLLMGGLVTVLDLIFIPVMRRRYEEVELRRMRALDAPA